MFCKISTNGCLCKCFRILKNIQINGLIEQSLNFDQNVILLKDTFEGLFLNVNTLIYIVNLSVILSILNLHLNVDFNITFYPAGNYMFKVYNRNTRTRGEICSKLTIKKFF